MKGIYYDSPLGRMWLVEDGTGLCGVWFVGQKYYAEGAGNGTMAGQLFQWAETGAFTSSSSEGQSLSERSVGPSEGNTIW